MTNANLGNARKSSASPARSRSRVRVGDQTLRNCIDHFIAPGPPVVGAPLVVVGWTGANNMLGAERRPYRPEEFALDVAHWAVGDDGVHQFRVGRLVPQRDRRGYLELALSSVFDAACRARSTRSEQEGSINSQRQRGLSRFALLAQLYLSCGDFCAQARPRFAMPTAYYPVPADFEASGLLMEHDGMKYAMAEDFAGSSLPQAGLMDIKNIKGRMIPNPARLAWVAASRPGKSGLDLTFAERMEWLGMTGGVFDERQELLEQTYDDLYALLANNGKQGGPNAGQLVEPEQPAWIEVPLLSASVVRTHNGRAIDIYNTWFEVPGLGNINLALPDPRKF